MKLFCLQIEGMWVNVNHGISWEDVINTLLNQSTGSGITWW